MFIFDLLIYFFPQLKVRFSFGNYSGATDHKMMEGMNFHRLEITRKQRDKRKEDDPYDFESFTSWFKQNAESQVLLRIFLLPVRFFKEFFWTVSFYREDNAQTWFGLPL